MVRIKSDWTSIVKKLIKPLLLLTLISQSTAFADDLPEIEALAFKVRVVRKTKSGRVYLFDDLSSHKPPQGKIFLVKENQEPAMAFRVLKQYADKPQFAAKRVRQYQTPYLESSHEYIAWQKLRDLHAGPSNIPVSEEDQSELQELENAAISEEELNDEELARQLDKSTPEKLTRDEELTLKQLEIREYPQLDRFSHWLSLQMGLIRNLSASNEATYYTGGGIRYGLTVGKRMLAKQNSEDSLVLEGTIFYYRVLQFLTPTDEYTMTPWGVNLRYNLMWSETFGFFLYGGFLYNYILSSQGDTAEGIALLGGFVPSFGTGLLYTMGPHWQLRLDLGYDLIGIGLVLRY